MARSDQAFNLFLYLHIAIGVSLEIITTNITIMLGESFDSVGRQFEAHLLQCEEVDAEYLVRYKTASTPE
jgi:hypothetical protein